MSYTNQNIIFSLKEKKEKKEKKGNKENKIETSYDFLINKISEEVNEKLDKEDNNNLLISDNYYAEELNYTENFIKKDLSRIADYYSISKRKKKKYQLVQDILLFEKDLKNINLVTRRKTLWGYLQELKEDKYLKQFITFN
jgi:hypothetical protein